MKLLSLSLALLLLLSYSCYSLEDRLILELQQSKDPYTQNLAKDSTLTNQEKKDIYLNNFYSFNPATNFNTIDQLNTYIDFHDYPYTQQSKYIKNAWLKIIYINPSILDTDNNLLISTTEKSKIYTDYNYTLEFNNTYPNDCRTEHKFTKQTTTQKTYLFENFLCNEKICDFQTKNSSAYNLNKFGKVKTSLNIDIQVEIYHYRTLCTGEGEGEHRTCSCKFSHTETDTDTITVEDQVNIKTEQLPQPPKLIYDQTTKYLYITDTGKINNYQIGRAHV